MDVKRSRNWATVVYPESAPENWQEKLAELKIGVMISPLHDKDTNPTGEPKKPHYHVLLIFESVKTREQVEDIRELIGGVGLEQIKSLRAYARYLVHADNPEKAQYSQSEVITFGGVDYFATCHIPTDDLQVLKEMMSFCRDNQIHSFAVFADICAEDKPDWFYAIAKGGCGFFMKEYIKTVYWESSK